MTDQDYSPEQIRFWLSGKCPRCRWAILESAVEGGTGCSGRGAGHGERYGLAHLKADLEQAADRLPAYWQSTELIYRKQHRSVALSQRRQTTPAVPEAHREPEHPVPSQALQDAIWRMSRSLGWSEGLTTAA